ncbi:extracellular solute-binding protein [Isoptericola sp. NPDC057653]|uniref:extracellular solute-binding protein n=1 Tax=unclassified Isoptericola TaxID=2623355 RepID=UPI0036842260
MPTTTLRGLIWDHPRAVDPILRATDEHEARTGTTVAWTARPLEEFEDVPLDELAEDFDVLAIDHPFVGDAARNGALAPLSELVAAGELDRRDRDYVGPSLRSYLWEGRLMALPVDAACMVSAARTTGGAGVLPRTWQDAVLHLASLGPERTLLAANPTHLWGTFLSMCEAVHQGGRAGDRPAWWGDGGLDEDTALGALDLLRDVLALVPERSFGASPIQVLDELAGAGAAVYSPLVFGYVTYALERPGAARVAFGDAPSGAPGTPTGSLTGGVGLAVSARSTNLQEAADFVLLATSPDVQAGSYAAAGGQPAAARAWHDPGTDRRAGGFFGGTLATMERSFLRPRGPGYPRFQRAAATALHDLIRGGARDAQVVAHLDELWAGARVG